MVPLQSPNTVEFVQSLQMWFCFYHFFYFFIKHQYSWQHNNKTPSSDEQSIASDSQAHMEERNMDCKMGIQLLRYFAVHNVKYSTNIMHAWIDWAIGTRNNFFFPTTARAIHSQWVLSMRNLNIYWMGKYREIKSGKRYHYHPLDIIETIK